MRRRFKGRSSLNDPLCVLKKSPFEGPDCGHVAELCFSISYVKARVEYPNQDEVWSYSKHIKSR